MVKSLVVYYSRTGGTKAVGEAIAKELSADCDEIVDLRKRTGLRPIRWLRAALDAKRGKLTEIQTGKKPEDYDLVVIGTPVWAGRMTPAVRTYLKEHTLEGKRLGFFCTASHDTEKAFEEMKKLVPRSHVAGTLGLRAHEVKPGSYEEKVRSFAEGLRGRGE
jgi:flavodoxin